MDLGSSQSETTRDPLAELVSFLQGYAGKHPGCSKADLAAQTTERFGLAKQRSVYSGTEFSVRFSYASGSSFSNVVLSLAALKLYDHLPFVVCVVRSTGIELLLSNSTFLKKISHSSHQLRIDNVRGSFLGHDILRTFDGHPNEPKNFNTLFAVHAQRTWDENLALLVEQTSGIASTGKRFEPTTAELKHILSAPSLASKLSGHREYLALSAELDGLVESNKEAILEAAKIDNVNLRGNAIEQIVTSGGNFHSVEDASRTLDLGAEVKIDIKTKILSLASSPKGYNVDKVLKALADGNTVVSFFFVGVDREAALIKTCLVSILDKTILDVTRIQPHWAGRSSRGATQLAGDLKSIFGKEFREVIDEKRAVEFVQKLIELKPPGATGSLP